MAIGKAGFGRRHRQFPGVVNSLQDGKKLLIELLPRLILTSHAGLTTILLNCDLQTGPYMHEDSYCVIITQGLVFTFYKG